MIVQKGERGYFSHQREGVSRPPKRGKWGHKFAVDLLRAKKGDGLNCEVPKRGTFPNNWSPRKELYLRAMYYHEYPRSQKVYEWSPPPHTHTHTHSGKDFSATLTLVVISNGFCLHTSCDVFITMYVICLVHACVAIRLRPAPWSARVMAPLVGSASRRRCVGRGARRRVSHCVWFLGLRDRGTHADTTLGP